ncbi:Symplekin [Araneus ventricosus]|uniref:Symplekin n=1 Tax=Araneus ventricosus TaxID=182803 RepID=A0A4Y2CZ85_ARAVE|nr:Symplekin [Araneus ventricosus]
MSGHHSSCAWKDQDERRYQSTSSRSKTTSSDYAMEQQYLPKKRAENEDSNHKSRKKAVDCRRSTAAQFFVEEETVQEAVTADRVVQLLRDASLARDDQGKLKNLQTVQELIIKKEPKLLDNFLDEVITFQHDQNPEVRKFALNFIEDACKFDIQILPKVVGNLIILLNDQAVSVQKKVIQTTAKLYTLTIKWLCKVKNVDEVMEATWTWMTQLKHNIFALLESDNEGVRALVVKFMECIVITQTFKDQYSQDDLSLDSIPVILKIFRPRKMEEEAKDIFQRIVDLHGASHVSSYNLMTCMQVLTTIARKRFEFFPKVLQAFESLHANLPPTLSQSQVSSVRKSLKLQLFILVKHPGAVEFHSRISIMLSDLGASPQQINKCFPTIENAKKRSISKDSERDWAKKPKIEDVPIITKADGSQSKPEYFKSKAKDTAIDITAEDLVPKLTPINVADLVLVSMLSLSDTLPAHFQSTYTPIAAAGTEPQVKHLSRLLATQLTLAGLGKGVEEMKAQADNTKLDLSDEDDDFSSKQIQTVVGQTVDPKPKKQALVLMPSGGPPTKSNKYSKRLDFPSVTKPLTDEESDRLCQAAYSRILNAEKSIAKRGAAGIRTKILTTLATQFRDDLATDLKNHILENPRSRLELAFNWIYQEYSAYRGFESSVEGPVELYEETINQLLSGVLENDEQNRILFSRFFIDPPYVTEGMAECLKVICTDEAVTETGLQLAKSMTIRRPTKKLLFLGVISDLTLHENVEIRSKAVNAAVEIHESGNMKSFIEAFALRSLKFLLSDTPSPSNFVFFSQPPLAWSEELTKVCLHLYLALLPINHKLIHDLGTVYVETSADIKRTILRALEAPVKGMSMASPELLRFVEKCPKGAETLVTRIIHILTDKAPPSAELVARVRDLYRKRVPDVRFLIPIINGLTKREVISALPELIKLNPTVVKEVFHRLLGSSFSSPLTPAELLVALHTIDPTKCNLKIVIKATSLCFEEKNVYTQVVLAMVMQQLMEQNPLPILLMRTVIQSLANYPHLLGFVTNILQRLIVKQVWKQKKIWEGFIKCCQRTKPQSFQVLLQLPPPQLQEVLHSCPDLRDPLCQHVETFTDHQKAHISKAVIDVLASFRPKDETDSISDLHSEGINERTGEPLPPGQDHM